VPLFHTMCGYSNSNWMFSLTTVLVFAVLMVASVVFLVRSFNHGQEMQGTAKDAKSSERTGDDEKS
jgi:hypothetical protein